MFPHTPGTVEAVSGSLDQRSGLYRRMVKKNCHLNNIESSLEVICIVAPNRFVPIQCENRNEDHLSLQVDVIVRT